MSREYKKLSFDEIALINRLTELIAEQNFEKIKDFLLNYNINVNLKNRVGRTPLVVAAQYGKVEIAKYLIEKGADVNPVLEKYDPSPLMYASMLCECDMILFLIKSGANLNRKIEGGSFANKTALDFAEDYINKPRKKELSKEKLNSREFLILYVNLGKQITDSLNTENLRQGVLINDLNRLLKSGIDSFCAQQISSKDEYLPDMVSLINCFCINEKGDNLIDKLVEKKCWDAINNFAKQKLIKFQILKPETLAAINKITSLENDSLHILGKAMEELKISKDIVGNVQKFLDSKDKANIVLLKKSVHEDKKYQLTTGRQLAILPIELDINTSLSGEIESNPALKPETSVRNPVSLNLMPKTKSKDDCSIL